MRKTAEYAAPSIKNEIREYESLSVNLYQQRIPHDKK